MKALLEKGKHPSSSSLLSDALNHLLGFVRSIDKTIFNERDLQVYLADKLRGLNYYDEIDLEYRLPKGCNRHFDEGYEPWETEQPSIDIVVRKGRSYIPIELKYKLKSFKGNFTRFGEPPFDSVSLIKDQSAQNIGRYQFWKDVKRLELLDESYKNVVGGIALFVTNDPNYLITKTGTDYEQFGMTSPAHGLLDWKNPYKKNKKGEPVRKTPQIELHKSYEPTWVKDVFKIEDESFNCCYIVV